MTFRDENETTERRVQKRLAQKEEKVALSAKGPPTRSRPANRNDAQNAAAHNVLLYTATPPKALTEPWQQQALCFFMSDRSIVPRHLIIDKASIATVVVPVCLETGNDSALMSILSSISLYSLSHVPGYERLVASAQQYYALAVSRLNKAIADPVASRRNDTLLCVLLFQLREIITMTNSSIDTWRQHSDGAIALCKMRGGPQTVLERRLYFAARNLMMTRRLVDLKRIPEDEAENLWTFGETKGFDAYEYERLLKSALDIPNLRAEAYDVLHRPMNASVAHAVRDLLAKAKNLDQRISTWPDTLPPSALYETLFTYTGSLPGNDQLDKLELWPGSVDFYWGLAQTHTWNAYRTNRAFILMVVINCTERLHSPSELEQDADYAHSVQVIRALVNDLCASVPYILYSSRIKRENAASTLLNAAHVSSENVDFSSNNSYNVCYVDHEPMKSTQFSDVHVPVPMPGDSEDCDSVDDKGHTWVGIGGMPLINSLYVASTLPCVPKEQRIWIRGRLRVIAESYSLDHANVLADLGVQDETHNGRKSRVQRTPTITDMAPLPWVE